MKALLVVDMPQTCKECKLKYLDTGDDAYWGKNVERCVWDNCEIEYNERAYDCPLKPMPERVTENVMKGMPNEEWQQLYDEGWNDCIKEIEK